MSFKSGLANIFSNFANWIKNTEANPQIQSFNQCAACDGIKLAQVVLQDAVAEIQTLIQKIGTEAQLKLAEIITEGQTKMAEDVTSICAKCPPAPAVTPPVAPNTPNTK